MDSIELKKRLEAAAAHGNPDAVRAIVRDTEAERFASDLLMARIGLSIGAVLVLGGGVSFLGVGASLPTVAASASLPLMASALVFFAIAAAFGFVAFALSPPPTELARTGIPAKVRVEDYRKAIGSISVGTRYSRRNLTRVAVDLTIAPWNAATYRATITQYLSGRSLAALHVGATLDAYVDPARPSRVLLVVP